jgi:hypothetical protein
MTLRLVPELLDTIYLVSEFNKFLIIINAMMLEITNIQSTTAKKSRTIDNYFRFDCPSDNFKHCILLGISYENDVNLADHGIIMGPLN